jgi:phenylalanyl-tRNA synthetase alpha chain
MSIVEKLTQIGEQSLKEIGQTTDLDGIEKVRIAVLGKKGALSEVLKSLGTASAEERPKIGAVANEWKKKIEAALDEKKAIFERAELESKLKSERIDVSLPSREPHAGSLHPVTQTTRKIVEVFARLGFDVMTGPEVETDFLNFEAVNMPADHPARDMQDTFFMGPGVVLRTHTSAVQMRAMRSQKWPVRILCPGAVYRSDSDATHLPMFHQIEGLWVDRGVKMSDLKGVLAFFAREIFGSDTKIRLRPSYFPFVEPGAEVDVSCFMCRTQKSAKSGDGCKLCKGTGWIEILGAGMVHPHLLGVAGYGEDYKAQGLSGFAFGVGIERVAMLLHGIPDLRLMVQGDTRFFRQF